MNSIGDLIKDRRLSKGWSKRALAEKAGISHSEVHRIENGERLNPSVPVLNALADALGIPKDDMLRLAGYKSDDGDIPMIEKAFPDLKTEKQQETAQKIIDGLARSGEMDDDYYDRFVEHMEMFIDHAKKKNSSD
jgi:transcriptional regulator with XRE-family HTH domain